MTEVALQRTKQICGDLAIITGGRGFDLWRWFKPEAHEVSHAQRILGHGWGSSWAFLAVRPPCRAWVRYAVQHLDGLPALFVGEESEGNTIVVHPGIDELLPGLGAEHVAPAMARALDLNTLWFEGAPSNEHEERLAVRFVPEQVSEADLDRLHRRLRGARDRSVLGSSAPSGETEK